MSTTWVIVIIVLVLGVVVGNITLLKYSAKFKFPTPSKPYDDDQDAASDKDHLAGSQTDESDTNRLHRAEETGNVTDVTKETTDETKEHNRKTTN